MKTRRIIQTAISALGIWVFPSCTLNDPASIPEQAAFEVSSSLDYGLSSQQAPYSIPVGYSSADLPLSSVEYPLSSVELPQSSLALSSYNPWPISSATASSSAMVGSSTTAASSAVILSSASTGTGGMLQVSFLPVTNNGEYCPSNVNAAWITSGTGIWIQNLEVRARTRVSRLTKWRTDYTKAVVQGVDGVAGATQGSFQAKNLSWDLTGKAQGNYTLKLEYSCDNFAGPYSTVNFAWNGGKIDTTVSFTYFKNVHLYYVP